MSENQVTDLSYLREMAMGDEEIVKDTAKAFLENIPALICQMNECYANETWQELRKLAHQIKSNMSYMGMDEGRSIVLDIENQIKNNNISKKLGAQLSEFEQICNHACNELTSKLKELN
ncbi:Hpt domain-containing protein [Fodinibius saliphilus]|uniref:Hpt domain-containing protein n=1 Tax=Fodinibius saliphilus TaxID=1920650 RepID=UPI001108AB59|nr:Hpt domain-containing protein [Fodinibius saliphilus]